MCFTQLQIFGDNQKIPLKKRLKKWYIKKVESKYTDKRQRVCPIKSLVSSITQIESDLSSLWLHMPGIGIYYQRIGIKGEQGWQLVARLFTSKIGEPTWRAPSFSRRRRRRCAQPSKRCAPCGGPLSDACQHNQRAPLAL